MAGRDTGGGHVHVPAYRKMYTARAAPPSHAPTSPHSVGLPACARHVTITPALPVTRSLPCPHAPTHPNAPPIAPSAPFPPPRSSLSVVYGITGEELDRTAALADAAGLPGATARRQVIVCAWLGLVGGLVDTFSSMWCTWTGLRTRRALNPLWALLVPVCVLAWPLRRLWRAVREPVCAVVGELCVCWLAAASCLPRRAVRRLAAAEQARRGHSAGEEEVVVVDGQKVYFGEWGGYVRGKLSGNGGEGCDGVHGGDGAGGEVLAGKRGEARGTRAILGVGVFAMDGAEVIVEVGEAA